MELEELNQFEKTYVELNEKIYGLVDGIEVYWGMSGHSGRLVVNHLKNEKVTSWLIGSNSDNEDYELYSIERVSPFRIYLKNRENGSLSMRVDANLLNMGYYGNDKAPRELLSLLIEKRNERGLHSISIGEISSFEANTIDDIAELFQLLENSWLKFG